MNRVFHYTKGRHIESILRDRLIRCATAGVPPWEKPAVWCSVNPLYEPIVVGDMRIKLLSRQGPRRARRDARVIGNPNAPILLQVGDRPFVAYPKGKTADGTPRIGRLVHTEKRWTMAEAAEQVGGLFRIEVRPESAPLRWKEAVAACGIRQDDARGLKRTNAMIGATFADWRASLEPICDADWLAVEQWDGRQWVDALEAIAR